MVVMKESMHSSTKATYKSTLNSSKTYHVLTSVSSWTIGVILTAASRGWTF